MKKEYQSPQAKEVRLHPHTPLLAGSGDMLFNSCEGNNETDLSKEDYDEWGW